MENTFIEKDSYINWSWKEDDLETVKIFAGGEILEVREDPGNRGCKKTEKRGMSGDLEREQLRWVRMSNSTEGTNPVFWRPSWARRDFLQ